MASSISPRSQPSVISVIRLLWMLASSTSMRRGSAASLPGFAGSRARRSRSVVSLAVSAMMRSFSAADLGEVAAQDLQLLVEFLGGQSPLRQDARDQLLQVLRAGTLRGCVPSGDVDSGDERDEFGLGRLQAQRRQFGRLPGGLPCPRRCGRRRRGPAPGGPLPPTASAPRVARLFCVSSARCCASRLCRRSRARSYSSRTASTRDCRVGRRGGELGGQRLLPELFRTRAVAFGEFVEQVQATTVAADQPVEQAQTLVTGDGLRSGRRLQGRLLPLRLGQFRLGHGRVVRRGMRPASGLLAGRLSRQRELRARRWRQEQQAGGEREDAAQAASALVGRPASQTSSSRHPDCSGASRGPRRRYSCPGSSRTPSPRG